MYALYAPSVPEFRTLAGDAAEGLLWSTLTGRHADRFGRSFARRMHQRFGTPPGLSSAGIHHDMIQVLSNGWAHCDSLRDFREIRSVLCETIHRGANGTYRLGTPTQTSVVYPEETLDPSIGQAHLVFQVQDGEHRVIAPAAHASSTFRDPG